MQCAWSTTRLGVISLLSTQRQWCCSPRTRPTHRFWGTSNPTSFVKDAFHDYVIAGRHDAVKRKYFGTKYAPHFEFMIQPGETRKLRLRLVSTVTAPERFFGKAFESVLAERQADAEEFYTQIVSERVSSESKNVIRQGYAGLLWSKQFYRL